MDWLEAIGTRIAPSAGSIELGGATLLAAVIGVAAAIVPAAWRLLRVGVTLVHELGHAFVGLLFGRRFTGFVVRGDMSGHAVTVGPARGVGRVATTWAGYPAPALVGALMIWAAARGWSAPLLSGVLLALLVVVPRIRSFGTAGVVLVVFALTGALWMSGTAQRQAQVVTAVGVVLIIGAWRHVGAVAAARGDRRSDPAVLARLTGVPRSVWVVTFGLVMALVTFFAGQAVLLG